MTKPQVCLNMIVKDEAPVIARCLESVMPYIDRAIIIDTGSTDETKQIIADVFNKHGKRCEIYNDNWVDFAHNRNSALDAAKAGLQPNDYLLFIDADEVLTPPSKTWEGDLTGDAYMLECEYGGWTYWRNSIVRAGLPWRWVGVIHEYLTCDKPHEWLHRASPRIVVSHDGARARDPDTYKKDIDVLEKAVKWEPTNARYRFYLAQSYKDAGEVFLAARTYGERAAMVNTFEEEAWFAQYQAGKLFLQCDREDVGEEVLLRAWQRRPWRSEPLVTLAQRMRETKRWELAYLYAMMAMKIPKPAQDVLFIDNAIYGYRALEEISLVGFYSRVPGAFEDGHVAAEWLVMNCKVVPEEHKARMVENLDFYRNDPRAAA